VAERAKRIQAMKEAEAEARRQKIKEAREFEEAIKNFLLISIIVVLTLTFFIGLFTVVL
jgi:hypothetical protein